MKSPDRIPLLLFALAAALLTGMAIAIPAKARIDVAAICRAAPVAGRLSGMP